VTQRPPGQVTGRKRVVLWPPTQDENLYVRDNYTGPARRKTGPKIASNKKTLYRESQKIPIPHPRLASPITLGLALS
jgi:hypothetical protein